MLDTGFAESETYPWGNAWVYDNDRDRQSPLTPILFIHGLGGSIYSWRFQLEALAPIYPILAIDLLGFGRSSKDTSQAYDLDGHAGRILEILDAKGIKSCYLAGCSLGGALCLWLMSQHPERFPKTLAISPAAVATVAPFPVAAYGAVGKVAHKVVSRSIVRRFLQGGLVHHSKITDEIVETYLTPFLEPGAMTCFFKSISTIKDFRIFSSLNTIKNPVLILRGGGDRVINRKIVQKISEANSQFSILEHPIAGHHLMEDEPEWVNAKILEYFEIKSTLST